MAPIISDNESHQLYGDTLMKMMNDRPFIKNQKVDYHKDSDKIAIIVDPRFDPVMEAVIRNFMYYMNPYGWNLLIISYSGYESEIREIFPNCLFQKINDSDIFFDENKLPNITIDTYNDMFLSKEFWESIPCKNVTIFQKDCIMFKMFNEYFFKYFEFSGANYHRVNHKSFYYGGINGGFSIRNKDTMLECLEKISWKDINDYRHNVFEKITNTDDTVVTILDTKNEDVFFTYACELLMKRVPDIIHRTTLSIEVDFNLDTCVYHGWNKNYHNITHAESLLNKSELFSKYLNNIAD